MDTSNSSGGIMKKHIRESIRVMCYSLMILMLFMGSQYVVLFISQILGGSDFVEQYMYLRMLISYGVVILGLIAMNKWEGKNLIESYLGFTKRMAKQAMKYAVVMWIGVGILNTLLIPFFPDYGAEINTLFQNDEFFLRFLVLVIGAPFIEEYLFREKVQMYAKKRLGAVPAIVFQGILFGIIHPFGMQKIYASAMGVGLGCIREKTNHLMGPTLIHILINGIGFLAGLLSMGGQG